MYVKEKIHVITLGCSKNTVDSERLINQIRLNDFTLTDLPERSDTVIINTCGFIEAAKEESINTILQAVQLKEKGKIKRVLVAGCLSERYKDDLRKDIPEVDQYFGTEAYAEIMKELGGELKYELLGERAVSLPSHTAYLKISEGCDNPCSFCAIPIMRGGHRSKSIEELVRETEYLAKSGAREIVIIGQDTSDYGKDLYGERVLARLLTELSKVDGIHWIRLMYVYPSHFPSDVLEVMATNPKIVKYIDIPLQHISDNVLKSMRRGITKRRTLEVLNEIREKVPGITLRTTMITGYPAETKEDFSELLSFIEEFKFDRLGVFTYSPEENTTGFPLGDPVSKREKNERKRKIMKLQEEISQEINSSFIGKTLEVLIEGKEGDFYIGRSFRDAPEVDGEVLVTSRNQELVPGSFYHVHIDDCNEHDLFGSL